MDKNIKIELPSLKYKDSFLAGAKEFADFEGRNFTERQYDKYLDIVSDEDFMRLVVQPKLDSMNGANLPNGWVAATDYWVIKTDNEVETYVGRVSLRHELTEHLRLVGGHIGYDIVPSHRGNGYVKKALRLVLAKAHEMGMSEVLITCDAENEASRRTIVGAMNEYGGSQDDPTQSGDNITLRYWVNTVV